MFYYYRGLRLRDIPLAIDVRSGHPCGFVSHAHADHYGAHELTLCTPATARLLAARWKVRQVRELPYGAAMPWNAYRLTTLPAGHVLGSAMLLVEGPQGRLLYTGDFQLRGSSTSEPAEVPCADLLVMESTYGHPRYRFPSRQTLMDQLLGAIGRARHENRLPVVRAYQLGKAQEVTRALTDAGVAVMIDPRLKAIHAVYEESGVRLGRYRVFEANGCRDYVVVAPPAGTRGTAARLPENRYEIVLSGWAVDAAYRRRVPADAHLPWSDHADYDELIECVERCGAKRVYCLHGQEPFVEELRRRGYQAEWLTSHTIVRPRP